MLKITPLFFRYPAPFLPSLSSSSKMSSSGFTFHSFLPILQPFAFPFLAFVHPSARQPPPPLPFQPVSSYHLPGFVPLTPLFQLSTPLIQWCRLSSRNITHPGSLALVMNKFHVTVKTSHKVKSVAKPSDSLLDLLFFICLRHSAPHGNIKKLS